ncbi:MAG TPA: regulatory protein RecX [Bacteroidales bacterium]|nr:regulatory protein RecX [Bacteroidales bacterium]
MAENALYKRALFKAMAHCSRRESCIDDIRNKLTNRGIGNNDANKIISRLQKENFINETRYATAFVRDKFNYNKWGKIKISAHLRKKNIPGDVIKTALDSIDDEAYKKLLENLIKGHKRSVKAKTQYELKAKLLRYGLSKGFESTLLYDLLNDLED